MADLTLYGSHVSPYVRKTRLVLAYKGLEYSHIPVIPVAPEKPAAFVENSPLGKIPLLQSGENFIPDSSVIVSFLEREAPTPALLPADSFDCARAQWFEEYADSHMVSVIGGHLFAEVVLAPAIFKRPSNQEDIDLAINTEIPAIFDYLSSQLKDDYLVGQQITLADIAVCGVFISMQHCKVSCDAEKWPDVAAYIDRVMSHPAFVEVIASEHEFMKAIA